MTWTFEDDKMPPAEEKEPDKVYVLNVGFQFQVREKAGQEAGYTEKLGLQLLQQGLSDVLVQIPLLDMVKNEETMMLTFKRRRPYNFVKGPSPEKPI
jgi:hypothetical protein